MVSKEAGAEALKSASLGAQQRTSVELVSSKVTGKDCHSALSSALHRHTGVRIVRLTQKHAHMRGRENTLFSFSFSAK